MKRIKALFIGMILSVSIPVFSQTYHNGTPLVPIELNCQIIDDPMMSKGRPRQPVLIPNAYINKEMHIVYFEAPCYESTIELVVPGTNTVAYSYSIPDGDSMVLLPTWLEGEYELHFHRGNYCFFGIIEL